MRCGAAGEVASLSDALEEDGEAWDRGELRDWFSAFDTDGDGEIGIEEFERVVKLLHGGGDSLAKAEVSDMFAELDMNGDGRINIDEFAVRAACVRLRACGPRRPRAALLLRCCCAAPLSRRTRPCPRPHACLARSRRGSLGLSSEHISYGPMPMPTPRPRGRAAGADRAAAAAHRAIEPLLGGGALARLRHL